MQRIPVLILVPTLLLAAPTLGGCSAVAEKATEKMLENATGADVDLGKGQVSVTDESGNTVTAGENVELPANWPSSIPAFDGKLVTASSNSGTKSYTAMWTSEEKTADAYKSYKATLAAAGFTDVTSETNAEGGSYLTVSGNGYELQLIVTDDSGKSSISLIVDTKSN